MKWKNKGREFDCIGNKFVQDKKIIIIGDNFEQANYYINSGLDKFLGFLNTI